MTFRIDKLGLGIGLLAAYGLGSPWATLRANRIVQGEAVGLFAALPLWAAWLVFCVTLAAGAIAILSVRPSTRLAAASVALATVCAGVGSAGGFLLPPDNSYARVSPASGFWILLFAFALLAADAITRMKPRPITRLSYTALAVAAILTFLFLGVWSELSIIKEYSVRADAFWAEAMRHMTLALGSLLAATIAGIPLGVFCERKVGARAIVLNTLNLIQTIPSIALFGMLIGPLAWIAVNVPGAAAAGIRGIGVAPAFVALLLYSILPIVANTVAGLEGVPGATRDAAKGLGMTSTQRLWRVEFPLALPVILTAIRIVLVQNIGLATIAALIGGGGFGTFVFQGLGQMATDLVLLGALPTVALAFVSAVVLDALIETTAAETGGKGAT
ncbi:ABC transporter permease [Pseudorhizobium endolithicum]|uniref:ABC transporter permease n=1 Tax=Pseudorhizobium endolithicum TaxID=1191678 RepID=A0ABN7JY41_9HYPH|nr:ABC transporter permease [Pseudorhizobium endolithicum]CAD7053827.1 ABC transporter permease [Pseudorhizobium endolithicum]